MRGSRTSSAPPCAAYAVPPTYDAEHQVYIIEAAKDEYLRRNRLPEHLCFAAEGEGTEHSHLFEDDDGGIPEDKVGGGTRRKPVPSKLVIKAARARRARHNKAAIGDNIQNSAVK